VCLALAVLLGGVVQAAEAPISAEAKKHVEQGVVHYDAGRFAEAIKEFDLAYRLSHRPALLFNIARAEAKLGHEDIAIAFLRRYLEERPDAPDAPAVLAEIDARERALEASKDKMKAEAEAQAARKQADELAAQARAQAAPPPPAVVVAAPPPAPARSTSKALRYAGGTLVAVGPVLAAVGIGLGVAAIQAGNDVSANASTGGMNFATCCLDIQSRGHTNQAAGIALDVIGGAVTVTGAVLLGISYKKEKR
jgi:tetratricopeptide (TPR) repeat protein